MVWSPSDIIALIALLVGIPTSCIGVWTLRLCLKAQNRKAHRKLYPDRLSSTPMELEIVPLRGDTPRTPFLHARISTILQLSKPQHDMESLTEYRYVMRVSNVRCYFQACA
ncbi:hypothetical protein BDW60DRAFT_188045 [Aspergillus nidulans var. acristatus]